MGPGSCFSVPLKGPKPIDTAAPGQRQEIQEAPERTAQQHRACLALRPWVRSPVLEKERKGKRKKRRASKLKYLVLSVGQEIVRE